MMHLRGLGIISPFGRGLEGLRAALRGGPAPSAADGFLRVPEPVLKDPVLAKEARRAGRFERMAVLAGLDALAEAGLRAPAPPDRTGLIVATALGPHVATFRFLDDLVAFNPGEVSPTLFSHSVHNAAASYLSLLAGLRGPTLTLTRFSFAFHEALGLAQAWLEQDRCEQVLVGVADELGSVMERVLSFRDKTAPGHGTPTNALRTEGSVFFMLSMTPSAHDLGRIGLVSEATAGRTDELMLLEGNALPEALGSDRPTIALDGRFGRQACPGALSSALATLVLNEPDLASAALGPDRSLSGEPEACLALARDDRGTTRWIRISGTSERK